MYHAHLYNAKYEMRRRGDGEMAFESIFEMANRAMPGKAVGPDCNQVA